MSLTLLLLTCGLTCLNGCGELTIGPRTQTDIVFIRHQGVAARVSESKRVKVTVEKDGKVYTQVIDIGGFYLISPDLKDAPKP